MVSSTPFAHNITQKKAAPETSANAQQLRQLSIKTGVVRRCARTRVAWTTELMHRLFKEESIYKAEVVDAQARVEKLKADGVDGADIRNAVSVQAGGSRDGAKHSMPLAHEAEIEHWSGSELTRRNAS